MTMKEKYESTLQQMQKDATIRLKAANDSLIEKQEEYKDCLQRIADLQQTECTSRKQFLEVGKAIIAMYFRKTQTPEEVQAIIEPCNSYVAAAGALPLEKETLVDLGQKQAQAQDRQFKERELFSAVEKVLNSLPEEE